MNTLEIGSLSVDVIRKDIKNMHLAVYPPSGRVRLAVPFSVSEESMRLFAISKISWIRRQQRNFLRQDRIGPREFKERESHYFFGDRYLLRVRETTGAGFVKISGKKYLDVYVRSESDINYISKTINKWYRAELKKQLPAIIEKWENKIGVKLNGWGIQQMRTKWGSCNIDKKRIRINLEMAKKPLHCLEYIVVHEMMHLLERHHNDRFRSLMNYYMPHWPKLKRELNSLPIEVGT